MRIHSGEKRFACKQCLKYFSSAASVKQHMRTHLEENHVLVNTSYSQGGDLKRHMKAHSVVKPFSCKQCSNSFQKLKT